MEPQDIYIYGWIRNLNFINNKFQFWLQVSIFRFEDSAAKFPGVERVYKSCDSTDDFYQEFQSEFINTLNLPGMPPHKLILKREYQLCC